MAKVGGNGFECSVKTGRQGRHTSRRPESYQCNNKCILNQVLPSLLQNKILQSEKPLAHIAFHSNYSGVLKFVQQLLLVLR
jgi:hypothetical protein